MLSTTATNIPGATPLGAASTSCGAATFCHPMKIEKACNEESSQQHELPVELPVTFPFAIAKVHDEFISGCDTHNNYELFCKIERAWWRYGDDYADIYDGLPRYNDNFKEFGEVLFRHAPLLAPLLDEYEAKFRDFLAIRAKIPKAGCIIVNRDLTKIALVHNWDGDFWGPPKGRCDLGEDPFEGALRQVLKETGFDARPFTDPKPFLKIQQKTRELTLFLCTDVPEDTVFTPRTYEISAVRFFPLNEVPRGSYCDRDIRAALENYRVLKFNGGHRRHVSSRVRRCPW